jgi:hypothetical protein
MQSVQALSQPVGYYKLEAYVGDVASFGIRWKRCSYKLEARVGDVATTS